MDETAQEQAMPTRMEGNVLAVNDNDNQSTSQSTTLSELVRQLREQLNVDELEERFRDEEEVATPSPHNYQDRDYYVMTPADHYDQEEEGGRDFETVSSISRMSAITDAVLLSDPELGGGRILSLEPPQPDEATIDRPMPPNRSSRPYNTIPPMNGNGEQLMEPPVRSIITMGPVKDDPTFDTIKFGYGVMKVRRQNKGPHENSSDKSTDDEDSSNGHSCETPSYTLPPCALLLRRMLLLLTISFFVGGLAAFIPFLLASNESRDNPSTSLPEKQTKDSIGGTSDTAARDTDVFFTAPPTSSAAPTPAHLTASPTVAPSNETESPLARQTSFPTVSPSTPSPTEPTASPTATPSSSPTTLQGGVDSVLSDMTNVALIRTPQSPQNLAYQFVMGTTQFGTHSPQRIRQRYIMAVLYYATNGDGWERRTSWLEDSDECLWYSDDLSPCNEKGELVRLSLPGNNLIGEIPHELGFLSTLEDIVLRGNDLEGDIPSTLGLRLTNLRNLDLSWTQIDGLIPSSLGLAVSLKRISLVHTAVHGSIPGSFGELTKLEELLVVKTDLTGSMPAAVCDLRGQSLKEVWADCDAVDCPCCNYCCYEGQIEICKTV